MWAFQTKEHFKLLLIIVLLCSWPQFASTLHVYAKQLRKTSHSNRRSSKSLVESKLETRKHFRLLSNEDDSNKVENISPKSPLSVAVEARTLTSNKEIDKNIIKLLLPATLNFAIVPLVGAADTFWVGRMHNALALAGQGAANQIFNSAFFIFSFLPNVITPLIAKAHGSDDKEGVKSRVAEALFICMVVGIIGTGLLSGFSERVISLLLKDGMPARTYAIPYLRIRAFTFLPCLLSTVGFAVYRGTLDVYTPLFISLVSNIVNVVLDPVLIFSANMGVAGAALATCASELTSFLLYTCAFIQKGLMPSFRKLSIPPSFELLLPMLLGGLSMQMRSIALNIAMLAVNRVAQGMDSEGVYAAAHTLSLQVFQLGSVLSMALSTVAAVLIPSVRAKHGHNTYTALTEARQAANRLLTWSVFVGCFLAGLQLSLLPLLSFFSPLLHVQEAARLPTVLGAALQLVNCIVWTGEGIQTGNQRFAPLAATTLVATVGMLVSLRYMKHSLVGVWGSFGVLAGVRLLGVLREHNRAGPLAPNEMQKVRDHKEL